MVKWLLAVFLGIMLLPVQGHTAEKQELKDKKDRLSYSIGMNLGNDFKKQSIDINPDILIQGMKDALSGSKTLLNENEMQEIMSVFRKEAIEKQIAQFRQLSEKNKKEGEAFLAENKKKEGVITLPSGLQYKVIKAGSGSVPKETDTVQVHYRGTLIDGTEFDSSYSKGEPVSFGVKNVIAGWKEALQLMPVGSKWRLFVPSILAYGGAGHMPKIGPNAMLIFEVELISLKEAAKEIH